MNNHAAYEALAALSRKTPKTASIIFYTPRRFEGNLKYAFLETVRLMRQTKEKIDVYFLTENPEDRAILVSNNLPCLYWHPALPKPYSTLLKASVLVEDGFFNRSSAPSELHAALQGAIHVNLWHGTPIKQIHLQVLDQRTELDETFSAFCAYAASMDLMCMASPNHEPIFKTAFSPARSITTGYPRNDVLLRRASGTDLINSDISLISTLRSARAHGKKIVLYAPTYRNNGPDWITASTLESLNSLVRHTGGILVFNPHPFEREALSKIAESIKTIEFPNAPDIYPLLQEIDALVTDYSSLTFDYALLGRPIILFRPDHEDYLQSSKQLIPQTSTGLGLPESRNLAELADMLTEAFTSTRSEATLRLRSLHNHYLDSASSRRVAFVLSKLAYRPRLRRLISQARMWIKSITNPETSPTPTSHLFEFKEIRLSSMPDTALRGMSHAEPWGRWTDAPTASIQIPFKLPKGALVTIYGHAFGPNCDQPLELRTAPELPAIRQKASFPLTFLCEQDGADHLYFTIPRPTSPAELGLSPDQRKLGIGLERISVLIPTAPAPFTRGQTPRVLPAQVQAIGDPAQARVTQAKPAQEQRS